MLVACTDAVSTDCEFFLSVLWVKRILKGKREHRFCSPTWDPLLSFLWFLSFLTAIAVVESKKLVSFFTAGLFFSWTGLTRTVSFSLSDSVWGRNSAPQLGTSPSTFFLFTVLPFCFHYNRQTVTSCLSCNSIRVWVNSLFSFESHVSSCQTCLMTFFMSRCGSTPPLALNQVLKL